MPPRVVASGNCDNFALYTHIGLGQQLYFHFSDPPNLEVISTHTIRPWKEKFIPYYYSTCPKHLIPGDLSKLNSTLWNIFDGHFSQEELEADKIAIEHAGML